MLTRQYFIEQASASDPREAKLPAWARDKLDTLRRATSEAVTELSQLRGSTEPGPFWLDNWHNEGNRFYLPRAAGQLHFASAGGDLGLTNSGGQSPDGYLMIAGSGEIVVRPWASNVVLVKEVLSK